MSNELDDFFRCVPNENLGGWAFEVGIVTWHGGPHTPQLEWKPFRLWKTLPNERRLQKAQAAALAQTCFFRTCVECHEVHNAGHMFGRDICQGCAERNHGVVH